MSIKNKNLIGTNSIKIDQLLSERAFIDFCRYDFLNQIKLDVNSDFLRALEKDGFLEPLSATYIQELDDKTKHPVEETKYYSPHQIYIVASFANNIVEDGELWTPKDREFYKQRGNRYVTHGWNGYSFIMPGKNVNSNVQPYKNIAGSYRDFHKFLMVIHSLSQQNIPEKYYSYEKESLFRTSPKLLFDFTPLETKADEILKKNGLSTPKLEALLANIGAMATQIDPLEYWYSYIKLHPRDKKELLKGQAGLAQDLYNIYDILNDLLSVINRKKYPPLLELLYGSKFYPYLMLKSEYLTGTDVKSLKLTIDILRKWALKVENDNYWTKADSDRLNSFEEEISDFINRYGDKRKSMSGVSRGDDSNGITIDMLDDKTKRYVGQLRAGEDELASAINSAMGFRLSELARYLWSIIDSPYNKIQKEVEKAWRDIQNPYVLDDKNKKVLEDNAKIITEKRNELDRIRRSMDLILCQRCREKPVKSRDSRGFNQLYGQPLCDDCLGEISRKALTMNLEEWNKIKEGEWICIYCGNKILFKFAHNNVLSLWAKNNVPIKTELIYGKVLLEAKCTGCSQVNSREIEWGWSS